MKKKRFLIIILTGMLLMSGLLTACENNTVDNEKHSVSVLAKNSWYTTIDYENCSIIKQIEKQCNQTIEWKLRSPLNYYDAVRPLILSNSSDLADIIQLPDLDTNMEYIKSGQFIKLDEYMNEMPNFSQFLKENPDIEASLTTEDGHIYYVPQTVLTTNYQPCIMYNEKWLEELGISEPQTLDEFVDMLRLFAQNDMNGDGDTTDEIPMSVMSDFIPYMFGSAFGLDLVSGFYADEDGQVHYSYYEKDKYKEFLTFLNNLYNEGLLESSYETLNRDEIANRCASNKTGVIFDYSWQLSSLYNTQYSDYNGTNPIFSAGIPLSGEYPGYYVGRNAISGLFGVNSYSHNIEDAVKLLDELMSQSSQDVYCWGIQGLTYEIDDEGNKYYTNEAHDDAWLQKQGINPTCVPSQQSAKATNDLVPLWHRKLDKLLSRYVKAPFAFIYATQDESKIINGYENYIAQFVNEQSNQFITGKNEMGKIGEYFSTLEGMNINQIIQVKQNQYERYSKTMKNTTN